jgi:rubrerythrin
MAETGMCDCCYNITKQLEKKAQFLFRAEGYLKDAQKSGHKDCEKVMKQIVADEKKHVDLLKGLCGKGVC